MNKSEVERWLAKSGRHVRRVRNLSAQLTFDSWYVQGVKGVLSDAELLEFAVSQGFDPDRLVSGTVEGEGEGEA